MKKFIIALVVIVIVVFFGVRYLLNKNASKTPDELSPLTEYFQENLVDKGVKDVGQPIEGFDADLLTQAFPGLKSQDFQNVETIEGHYEITNGTLSFLRDRQDQITSAEKAISKEGYNTLLQNVSRRLDVLLENKNSVDLIIDALDTGDRIEVSIGKSAEKLGVKVTPKEIVEDSRCPSDVQCIQAGTVRVRVELESGSGKANQIFELNKPITTEVETVELVSVSPDKFSTDEIKPSDYIFIFQVTKR